MDKGKPFGKPILVAKVGKATLAILGLEMQEKK